MAEVGVITWLAIHEQNYFVGMEGVGVLTSELTSHTGVLSVLEFLMGWRNLAETL